MSELIETYDDLLKDNGPAAIVFTRKLRPVEGRESWIFPPTFARSEAGDEDEDGSGGDYQIDPLPNDIRTNVCLIDSIGSQANRMEPIFKKEGYSALVPQVRIQMKDGGEVNLLDAGHRAADAAIRFSTVYGPKLNNAFRTYLANGDCAEIVKIAPTSLVFGVWDSRGTGAKIQRIVRSVIRAYNVTKSKRSATYRAAYDYTGNGVLPSELDKGSGKSNPLSQEGFKYSLATETHGGVLVKGDIQQEALINLVALRTLTEDRATKRYLLGLALVALSYTDQEGFNLREGCLLCADSKTEFHGRWRVVSFDGTEEEEMFQSFTHGEALTFAKAAAQQVHFEQPQPDKFDDETAQKWLTIDKRRRKVLGKAKHPQQALADEEAAAAKKKAKQAAAAAPSGESEAQ